MIQILAWHNTLRTYNRTNHPTSEKKMPVLHRVVYKHYRTDDVMKMMMMMMTRGKENIL